MATPAGPMDYLARIWKTAVGTALAVAVAASLPLQATADLGADLWVDDEGWHVSGLDVALVSTSEDGAMAIPSAGSSLLVGEVQANDRQYLYDSNGSPVGMLSGLAVPVLKTKGKEPELGTPVHPLSYVVERDVDSSVILSWRSVTGADIYDVQLNGKSVEQTAETSARLLLESLTLNDLVTIDAIDSDASEVESLIGTMGLVVSDFTLGSSDTELSVQEGSHGEIQVEPMATALPTSHYFRFIPFIPNQYVEIGFWETLGCKYAPGGSLPTNAVYFGGDNRSYSYSASTFRTKTDVHWTWATTTQGYTRAVGATRIYNSSKSQIGSKTASVTGIEVFGPYVVNALEKRFHIRHAVANPWCSSASAINYSVDMYVDRTAGYNGFTASGSHDRAPNYEFYYDDNTISPVRFRGWAMTPNQFFCLSACTAATFSIVK